MSTNTKTTSVWYVAIQKDGATYYVADYDTDNNTLLWCKNRKAALHFKNELVVGSTIGKMISNRPEIFLVYGPEEK